MKVDIESMRNTFVKNKAYKPYISSIIFSQYKNIFPGTELTFDFPLTLLIGKNGTNKSSILHALYGSPEGKSPGEYWFATYTDPINQRPAFFYRYIIPETGDEAEVLKTLIQKKLSYIDKTDPDYWEPSRPVIRYGMKPMPEFDKNKSIGRSKTRWEAIKKDVLYLDFRAEISAFDKAFFNGDKSQSRQEHRRKLRTQTKALKEAIDNRLTSKVHYLKERIYKNYRFTKSEIDIVNSILDAEYLDITYIEHDFFLTRSFSVYLKKNDENIYSEAFAGSGETSIVRLVYALENAEEKALILLDEPETSLHIGAQHKLQEFLLKKITQKHLQIVISTHSPYFAKNLPDCAIKVLQVDPNTQKIVILNSASSDQSSFYLGQTRRIKDKAQVYVEDRLACAIIKHVWSTLLSPADSDSLDIQHFPGGDTGLLHLAGAEMTKSNSNVFFLFDGDRRPLGEIPDPKSIPEIDDQKLDTILTETFGRSINSFLIMDFNNPQQRVLGKRLFLQFARKHFAYLPFRIPEEFIVKNHPELAQKENFDDPKRTISDYAEKILGSTGEVKSAEIFTIQRKLLSDIASGLGKIADFEDIKTTLTAFLKTFRDQS